MEVQRFLFDVYSENDIEVSFKLSNFSETGKSFDDKKEDYLLEIKISR